MLARIGLRAFGDDSILRALKSELEREGFRIVGPDSILSSLLAGSGSFESALAGRVPPIESEDATRMDIIAVLAYLSMTHPLFRSLNRSRRNLPASIEQP